MRTSITLLTLLGLVPYFTEAAYSLQDDYSTDSFFSMFDFFTADDPTHGYVNYVDSSTATSSGLAGIKNGQVYMGVDTTSVASGRGRNSVRITSKQSYNAGSLIILDLSHMPGSICGTWPAFWTVGPSWPNNGEIDIIEGVNTQSSNHYAVHTSSGCSISNTGLFTGTIETQNCDVNDPSQPNNAGCGIVTSDSSSYGDGFNAVQGGVYATEFTSSAISIWFFSRSSIPADITSGSPNPSTWGKPHASFGSPCNIGQFVKQQQIVFDTTFCGDWAGSVWSTDATCSAKSSSCQNFVQNNPSAFMESYWSINSLKVYSGSASGGGQPGGSGTLSQQPTVSGGVPTGAPGQTYTGQPGISGGVPPKSSFGASMSVPAPSASQWNTPQAQTQPQPQQQSRGGANGNKFTISALDGNQLQQPTGAGAANNVATAPSAGGQFYDAGTGVVAAAGSGTAVGNTYNTATATAAAAPTGSTANTNTNVAQTRDETLNAYRNNAANVPVDANAGTTTDGGTDISNANAAGTAPQPQYQDFRTGSPSVMGRPSRTVGAPWMRHSWNGKYVTVTAMADGGFQRAKREVEALLERDATNKEGDSVHQGKGSDEPADAQAGETTDEEDELKRKHRRDVDASEALRRRDDKAARSRRESEHLHGHRHRHVGRSLGRWRS